MAVTRAATNVAKRLTLGSIIGPSMARFKSPMIHMLHPSVILDTCYFHECRNAKNACPELAVAHSPASGEASIPARQNVAPVAGHGRDRGQECRACAAHE